MKTQSIEVTAQSSVAPVFTTVPYRAPGSVPRFEIDASWPKPLPKGWITGQLGGVCVDHHDNIIVTNRGDITKEEQETCVQAPAVLIFDSAGDLIDAWGDWDVLPRTVHSCCVDADDNIWITANGDGMVQKYTHDGELLLQIGTKGVFDTSDGTRNGTPLNSGRNAFVKPAGITVDQFDRMGNFIRNIWIRTGTAMLPDRRGTAWWAEFSRDPDQKYLYVMNGRNEQVHIVDHERGEIVSSFGRPGHQLGNFTHGHSLAVDSRGCLYVAETNFGRRVHRFTPVS